MLLRPQRQSRPEGEDGEGGGKALARLLRGSAPSSAPLREPGEAEGEEEEGDDDDDDDDDEEEEEEEEEEDGKGRRRRRRRKGGVS